MTWNASPDWSSATPAYRFHRASWADPILLDDAIPRPTSWMAKANRFRNATDDVRERVKALFAEAREARERGAPW